MFLKKKKKPKNSVSFYAIFMIILLKVF